MSEKWIWKPSPTRRTAARNRTTGSLGFFPTAREEEDRAGDDAVRRLLATLRPGGLLLAVYHDLDHEHREHMKERGFDPADVPLHGDGRPFGGHKGVMQAAMVDGSVRTIRASVEPKKLAAAITIAGGEPVDLN